MLHGTTVQSNTENWREVGAGKVNGRVMGPETPPCGEELNDLAATTWRRKHTLGEGCSIHQAEQVTTRGQEEGRGQLGIIMGRTV